MRYLIVIEKTATGYSAYSPDLPGCAATASTKEAIEELMKGAVSFHLEGLVAGGYGIPEPRSYSSYMDFTIWR